MIELTELKQAVGDLEEALVIAIIKQLIEDNPSRNTTQRAIVACQQGMEIVGDNYEKGEYFVGDLIFAGELLATCIDMLKPLLGSDEAGTQGRIILGTVEGDIHDIGKNFFKSMCEAAGFFVIDIGIDQPASAFVRAVKMHQPDIVALSGVLTLSVDAMKNTVDALIEEGLRDDIKIQIGGNAASEGACRYAGADDWSNNAAESVKTFGEWLRDKAH